MNIRPWPYGFRDSYFSQFKRSPESLYSAPEQELIASIEYVLHAASLSEEQIEIIHQHFKDGVPFAAIDTQSGKTANALYHSALRLLKAKPFMSILEYGVQEYLRREIETCGNTMAHEIADKLVADKMREGRKELQKAFDLVANKKAAMELADSISISTLETSVRGYNAFHNSGYDTVGSIIRIPDRKTLLKIRNLGAISADEMLSRIYDLGFDVSHLR